MVVREGVIDQVRIAAAKARLVRSGRTRKACLRFVVDVDDAVRRGMDAVGLERAVAGGAEPMAHVRGQDERHPGLKGHDRVAALQPGFALAVQYRDGLEIGMGVQGVL